MITCPTCGAGNKPGATVCRMCALRLEESAPDQNPKNVEAENNTSGQLSTMIFPNLQTRPGTVEIGGEIPCPKCQALNEIGWLYCHGCGRKLNEPLSDAAPSDADLPRSSSAPSPESQKAGRDEAPAAARVTPPPQSQQEMDKSRIAQPKDRPVTESAPRVSEPPKRENTRMRPTEKPRAEKPLAATAASGVHCPRCGSIQSGNDPACSRCGAPIPVNQTVVMSSVVPTSQGRLRHILEGGESGEVYNLQGETVIGRTQGDISFAYDELMSSKHGRIVRRGDDFIYIDEGSRNGTFVKIKSELRLEPGDLLLIGKQLFRFEA